MAVIATLSAFSLGISRCQLNIHRADLPKLIMPMNANESTNRIFVLKKKMTTQIFRVLCRQSTALLLFAFRVSFSNDEIEINFMIVLSIKQWYGSCTPWIEPFCSLNIANCVGHFEKVLNLFVEMRRGSIGCNAIFACVCCRWWSTVVCWMRDLVASILLEFPMKAAAWIRLLERRRAGRSLIDSWGICPETINPTHDPPIVLESASNWLDCITNKTHCACGHSMWAYQFPHTCSPNHQSQLKRPKRIESNPKWLIVPTGITSSDSLEFNASSDPLFSVVDVAVPLAAAATASSSQWQCLEFAKWICSREFTQQAQKEERKAEYEMLVNRNRHHHCLSLRSSFAREKNFVNYCTFHWSDRIRRIHNRSSVFFSCWKRRPFKERMWN